MQKTSSLTTGIVRKRVLDLGFINEEGTQTAAQSIANCPVAIAETVTSMTHFVASVTT